MLRLQGLADGVLDAGVLIFKERQRPEPQQSAEWVALQRATIQRSLDQLESLAGQWGQALTLAQIAVGCTLGWLDFRLGDDPWREGRPALAAWYQAFASRPSMVETVPKAA